MRLSGWKVRDWRWNCSAQGNQNWKVLKVLSLCTLEIPVVVHPRVNPKSVRPGNLLNRQIYEPHHVPSQRRHCPSELKGQWWGTLKTVTDFQGFPRVQWSGDCLNRQHSMQPNDRHSSEVLKGSSVSLLGFFRLWIQGPLHPFSSVGWKRSSTVFPSSYFGGR